MEAVHLAGFVDLRGVEAADAFGLMPAWFRMAILTKVVVMEADHATIDTPEGLMRAERTDWVVRGVRGELYPCKLEIFAETYEPATAAVSHRQSCRDPDCTGCGSTVEPSVKRWESHGVTCVEGPPTTVPLVGYELSQVVSMPKEVADALPCPHGRDTWAMCPWCNGANSAVASERRETGVAFRPTPGLWTVYRCDQAEPDQACGIREETGFGVPRMVVSDTRSDECGHGMLVSDAQLICDQHVDREISRLEKS